MNLTSGPSVFGLHPNAEMMYSESASKEILINMLSMQSGDSGDSGDVNKDDVIDGSARNILDKMPERYE